MYFDDCCRVVRRRFSRFSDRFFDGRLGPSVSHVLGRKVGEYLDIPDTLFPSPHPVSKPLICFYELSVKYFVTNHRLLGTLLDLFKVPHLLDTSLWSSRFVRSYSKLLAESRLSIDKKIRLRVPPW